MKLPGWRSKARRRIVPLRESSFWPLSESSCRRGARLSEETGRSLQAGSGIPRLSLLGFRRRIELRFRKVSLQGYAKGLFECSQRGCPQKKRGENAFLSVLLNYILFLLEN